MSFMPREKAQAGLRKIMVDQSLTALVAVSPENFTYVSGAHVSTLKTIRSRLAFAVLPLNGAPFIVTCSLEKSLTASESWIKDIRTYFEFKEAPVEPLAAGLIQAGLGRGRLGIDLSYLPAASYTRLTALMPDAEFVDTTEAIALVRAVKTADEIAILERATKDTHRAVLDAMAASSVGESERTMQNRIANNMINNGADGIAFMCFGSGKKAQLFHAPAAEDVFPKRNEVLRFDVGATYGAWSSDFARTYCGGEPNEKQRQTYRSLLEVEAATIDMIKPGILAEDVFFFCRDQMEKHKLVFYMPHVGHSFGVELHEKPMMRPGEKTVLVPGMVINIEPSTFDDERSAYHTEDLVLVTETGTRLLTLGLAPPEIPSIGEVITYRQLPQQ